MRDYSRRIEAMEKQLERLEKAASGWRAGSVGARRQPRVGATVPDLTQFPTYPAPPPPLQVDADGHPLPQGPHANVFPFLFTDAEFDTSGPGGIRSVLREDRTAIPVGRVCNLNGVYIPVGTPIPIFEDNGHYWTTFGSASAGPPGATQQLAPTAMGCWLAHGDMNGAGANWKNTTVAYPTDGVFEGFVVTPQNAMTLLGLGVDSAQQATATATVSGGVVTAVNVTNGGAGYTGGAETWVTVTLSLGSGSGATFKANISNGVITSIAIVSAGSGYTNGTYPLTISLPQNSWYPRLINITANTLWFLVAVNYFVLADLQAGQEMTATMQIIQRGANGSTIKVLNRWITVLSYDLQSKYDDGYQAKKTWSDLTVLSMSPGDYLQFRTILSPGASAGTMTVPDWALIALLHRIYYQPEYQQS